MYISDAFSMFIQNNQYNYKAYPRFNYTLPLLIYGTCFLPYIALNDQLVPAIMRHSENTDTGQHVS